MISHLAQLVHHHISEPSTPSVGVNSAQVVRPECQLSFCVSWEKLTKFPQSITCFQNRSPPTASSHWLFPVPEGSSWPWAGWSFSSRLVGSLFRHAPGSCPLILWSLEQCSDLPVFLASSRYSDTVAHSQKRECLFSILFLSITTRKGWPKRANVVGITWAQNFPLWQSVASALYSGPVDGHFKHYPTPQHCWGFRPVNTPWIWLCLSTCRPVCRCSWQSNVSKDVVCF